MSKKRIFTDEEIELMINMYHDGETYRDIGKLLQTKDSTVSKILKSKGYPKRHKNTLKNHDYLSASRKNSLNESYFDVIDTQSKAYWLGFLYADGYINKGYDKDGRDKGGSIELSLKRDDKYHIENFLNDIGSTACVSNKDVYLNGKKYEAARTCIGSIKMVNQLINLGCTPRKSLTLMPPSLDDELVRHFIRGYFDGDGCVVFIPESYSYAYSILGTKAILEFIIESAELSHCMIRGFKHKQCFELRIWSKNEVERFHNYLYEDKEIFLDRKYHKSLAMMKWCGLNDSRTETQKMGDLLGDCLYLDGEALNSLSVYSLVYEDDD